MRAAVRAAHIATNCNYLVVLLEPLVLGLVGLLGLVVLLLPLVLGDVLLLDPIPLLLGVLEPLLPLVEPPVLLPLEEPDLLKYASHSERET